LSQTLLKHLKVYPLTIGVRLPATSMPLAFAPLYRQTALPFFCDASPIYKEKHKRPNRHTTTTSGHQELHNKLNHNSRMPRPNHPLQCCRGSFNLNGFTPLDELKLAAEECR